MQTLASAVAPAREGTASRAAYALACAVVGAAFVAVLAQVAVPLPFTPVPITGQTLGVLLVGAAYGPTMGAATLGLYLLWGAAGLPVFAPNPDGSHETGFAVLSFAGATGGYLWGFVVSAGVVGWLATHGWDRSVRSAIGAMFLGEVVLYLVAIPWLMLAIDVPLGRALELGLAPFVVGDTLKLLLAARLLPMAWRLAGASSLAS
jgi:biotin transport system substrate-specific component